MYYATCHHCHTRHNLNELKRQKVNIEPDTNDREEDTVYFKCPTCNQYVNNALVVMSR